MALFTWFVDNLTPFQIVHTLSTIAPNCPQTLFVSFSHKSVDECKRILYDIFYGVHLSHLINYSKVKNMRKIEQQMLAAIQNRSTWALDNTSVAPIDDVNSAIYLHRNHIADVHSRTGLVMVNKETLSRWSTPTTKSRLRALGANVATRKGITYLDNVAI